MPSSFGRRAAPWRRGLAGVAAAAAAAASLAAGLAAAQYAPPVVVTPICGAVAGTWDPVWTSLASFRGIPYGAPPVGAARWQPPRPAPCWNGTLDGAADGNECWQLDGGGGGGQSEDCLNLNVFSAVAPGAARVPVIAWIYGGSLVDGSVSSCARAAGGYRYAFPVSGAHGRTRTPIPARAGMAPSSRSRPAATSCSLRSTTV